jgi:cyclohexanecarboxylate-CoA ligase
LRRRSLIRDLGHFELGSNRLRQTVMAGICARMRSRWLPLRPGRGPRGCQACYHLTAGRGGQRRAASVRSFLTGAAAVPPSLVERADTAGIIAYRSYGSSGHPTVSSGAATDPLAKRAYTDGAVLAGNKVRLIDAGGRDVPAGQVGEIVTTGPELFLGYTDPALDAAAFLPGRWYRTGDLGFLDADGYLTVTDRLKDIIIRGGENISSKEIEDLLAEHPAIAEAAVVAAPDPVLGERVCAVVVNPGRTFVRRR